ncbi:hypothetical protein ACIP4U_00740 [Streptomyces caelestis]|uniref:hypothetical protein n=1 Tax=Streptomyces caelestis TaxID=36816 RepID=UPI00381AD7FC
MLGRLPDGHLLDGHLPDGHLLGGHLLDDHLPDGHLPFVQEEVAVVRGSGAYDAGLRSARPNRRA